MIEYFGKYVFLRKMFQTKVIRYKVMYLVRIMLEV